MSFFEYLDWVTPTLSLASRVRGKTDTIIVPESKSVWAIGVMLGAGIKIKYPSTYGDKFAFDVPRKDAKRARELLG